jgi:hypothetical protein
LKYDILFPEFKKDHYPDRNSREALAQQLHLPEERIQVVSFWVSFIVLEFIFPFLTRFGSEIAGRKIVRKNDIRHW